LFSFLSPMLYASFSLIFAADIIDY
jgi:hypothetical protein